MLSIMTLILQYVVLTTFDAMLAIWQAGWTWAVILILSFLILLLALIRPSLVMGSSEPRG